MRYYVTGEDGNRYGPVDMQVLEVWARQGRLTPNSYLEFEHGGGGLAASAVPNLQFPPVRSQYTGAGAQPPGFNPYAGLSSSMRSPAVWGSWDVWLAWSLGILGGILALCGGGFLFGFAAIVVSVIALMRGRRAMAPLLLGIGVIILQVLITKMASGGGGIGDL